MSTSGEGWFADPHDASQLRWWDGTRWTEHTHQAVGPIAPGRPPLPGGWTKLAVAVQVLLAISIPVSVGVVLVNRNLMDVWRRIVADPSSVSQDEAEGADALVRLSLLEIPLVLVCGVLFIIWLYQAHRSDRMDPSWQKRRSGWAIGGWLVPVVNLWFPFQVVSDLRSGARGDAREPSYALQWCWWLTFLVYLTASRITGRLYLDANAVPDSDLPLYVDKLAAATTAELVTEVASVVAAVLAIVLVRQFTAWVRTSSAVPVTPAAGVR
jgi:hypothetical protein